MGVFHWVTDSETITHIRHQIMNTNIERSEKSIWIFLVMAFLMLYPADNQAQSQDLNEPLFLIGGRFHKAFIIKHTKKLSDEVTQSFPWSFEMEAIWHLRKKSVWDYCYCYPRTGVALNYTNFMLPDILGSAISVYPFIEPNIRAQNPLHYSVRIGMGPAYMTKIWNEETNPSNLLFSARISFFLSASFAVNYRFADRLSMRLAGNYNHISNSGYKLPNLGINFPSLSAGLDYSFSKPVFQNREKDPDIILNQKKNRFDILFGISAKPTSTYEPERYPVYVVSMNYSHLIGRRLAIIVGTEWVDDKAIRAKIIQYNWVDDSDNYLDHNRIGALAGIEWLIGKFIFYQQLGYEVYTPLKPKYRQYQRYGLSFKLSNHLFIGVNLKANMANADFMDLRAGISF